MDKLLLTPLEAGALVSLSRSSIYELMDTGEIESVRIGQSRRIVLSSLEAWVNGLRKTQNGATG